MYLEIIHYYNNALYTNIKSIILAEYYHVHIHYIPSLQIL